MSLPLWLEPLWLEPLFLPSPSQGVWYLGPLPIRGYALSIIAGIICAIWLGEKRWVARGGRPGDVSDLAVWAVPFGVVGGRLYHVMTDWKLYFGPGGDPMGALYVWRGGLGVWGAIALGAVGVFIGCRLRGITVTPFMDAIAPGIVLAQGIGRWGNWFNQELFGRPTTLPWALEIDPQHRPVGYEQYATFHPTFLYEFGWDVFVCLLLVWADRRFRLGHGRVVALYVMAYTAGRGWIEDLRIDDVQMNDVFGLRLNVWTSVVLFVLAAIGFWWSQRTRPGRETSVRREGLVDSASETPDEDGVVAPALDDPVRRDRLSTIRSSGRSPGTGRSDRRSARRSVTPTAGHRLAGRRLVPAVAAPAGSPTGLPRASRSATTSRRRQPLRGRRVPSTVRAARPPATGRKPRIRHSVAAGS